MYISIYEKDYVESIFIGFMRWLFKTKHDIKYNQSWICTTKWDIFIILKDMQNEVNILISLTVLMARVTYHCQNFKMWIGMDLIKPTWGSSGYEKSSLILLDLKLSWREQLNVEICVSIFHSDDVCYLIFYLQWYMLIFFVLQYAIFHIQGKILLRIGAWIWSSILWVWNGWRWVWVNKIVVHEYMLTWAKLVNLDWT